VVGLGHGTTGEAPSLDHYGLKASFQICQKNPGQISKASVQHDTFNVTPDTLLAFVLGDTRVLGPNLFNKIYSTKS